jgi:putative transposase
MARRQKEVSRLDQMLDELIGENPQPEDILGETGLLKQLTQRLVERALTGELTHHLKTEGECEATAVGDEPRRNSRNGHSKKTVQSAHGAMELAIPRDRAGEFEPILVAKHQRRLAGLDEKIIALYAKRD